MANTSFEGGDNSSFQWINQPMELTKCTVIPTRQRFIQKIALSTLHATMAKCWLLQDCSWHVFNKTEQNSKWCNSNGGVKKQVRLGFCWALCLKLPNPLILSFLTSQVCHGCSHLLLGRLFRCDWTNKRHCSISFKQMLF